MLKTDKDWRFLVLLFVWRGIILLSLVTTVVNFLTTGYQYDFLYEFFPALVLGVFLFSYSFITEGFILFPVLFLIGFISSIAFYLMMCWGTMLPQGWILLSMSIIISGILLKPFLSLVLATILNIFLLLITYLQSNGVLKYQTWDQSPMVGSILVANFTLFVIATISCLSNREIEKALRRAKKLEIKLKKERDGLEIEVEKRTKELKKVQLERMVNLYKFADFGRLTAGMFHDISNPLTQVSLSLSNIELQTKNKISSELNKLEPTVRRAINGTKQMERLIVSVRKQVQQQETDSNYQPWMEIEEVMESFEYRAKEINIQIDIVGKKEIYTFGNSIRFYQLISNLISNALDSYYGVKRKENRKIIIELDSDKDKIILSVRDFGCGMGEEVLKKIFDPLFSTKDSQRGTGVGLYISKMIVEQEFNGTIDVESKINEGSIFTVKFPIAKRHEKRN